MKNRVNINFILAMALVAGLVVLIIYLGNLSNKLGSGLQSIEESMSTQIAEGGIDDVEGYGLILEGIGFGLGAVAGVTLIVLNSLLGFYTFLLFLFALIARLVYARKGGRLLAYRILMTVEYLLQLLLIACMVFSLVEFFMIKIFILTLLISTGLVFSAMNTYSKKIRCME